MRKDTNQNFSITNTTKGKLPSLPFAIMKDKILGKNYDLSIAVVGDAKSKFLNNKFRGKNKPTNILSFPLTKNSGEIFLNLNVAKKEAPKFGTNFGAFTKYLVIHGLLHLKGMEHSSTMDKAERKWCKKFNVKIDL